MLSNQFWQQQSIPAGKVSHGAIKVSHGARKVSTDNCQSFALQEIAVASKKDY